jgi:hypothetical protein
MAQRHVDAQSRLSEETATRLFTDIPGNLQKLSRWAQGNRAPDSDELLGGPEGKLWPSGKDQVAVNSNRP